MAVGQEEAFVPLQNQKVVSVLRGVCEFVCMSVCVSICKVYMCIHGMCGMAHMCERNRERRQAVVRSSGTL